MTIKNGNKEVPGAQEWKPALFASIRESIGNDDARLDDETGFESIGVDSVAFVSICIRFENLTGLNLADGDFSRKPERIGDLVSIADGVSRNRNR